MLDLDEHTDQLMALAAFRYCLQRRSYIVGACQRWVRDTWHELTLHTRSVMIRDLSEGLDKNTVGDELSVLSWQELLTWMREQQTPEASTAVTRIYISGPMTGLPDNNSPAFHSAAAALRACGYEVVNPAEIDPGVSADIVGKKEFWQACMRADIRALCDCDVLALLPGWHDSDGANLELHLAHRLGLSIGTVQEFIERHATR